MPLTAKQTELREANAFIEEHHRHHKKVQGHRFSVGVSADNGETWCGVATCGRPVARMVDSKDVLEVTRLATDGTPNACSFLYATAARVAKELGYQKIQTYILDREDGTTLRAAGWVCEDDNCGGGDWNRGGDSTHKGRRTDQPMCAKQRWAKHLAGEAL